MAQGEARRLTLTTKIVYSLGDHTVNIVLSALTLVYLHFLTDVVHFSGTLAGLVPWIGRMVDAFTDPMMGRISDRTTWRSGRRRPYFLIGCVPFGVFFALLWLDVPTASTYGRFAWYAGVYVMLSLAMTTISVPYLALIPEMSRNYDERTSLNTWRSAAGIVAVFFTIGMSALARMLGDDARAWSLAAAITSVWLVLPWLAVHRVSWERPVASGAPAPVRFSEAMRALSRHGSYRVLCAVYIVGRIAVDITSVMFVYYVAWVIGRREDFEMVMFTFLAAVILALPFWLALARRFDKKTIYIAGVLWWIGAQGFIYIGSPEWPRWIIFLVAGFTGIGYAVADLMPWSMLPDVIDEDEAATGERREGLYAGTFTLLRKIGGATAVLMVGIGLDLARYDGSAATQPESAVEAIRVMMAVVPAGLLVATAWIARRYPLSREAHAAVLRRLEARAQSG
jgi:GPH family glycoside/pentoside/hexuronide:cation symporter